MLVGVKCMKKHDSIKIAYIGGGSKNWAWNIISDLSFEEDLNGEVFLYDIDFEAAKENEIFGNEIVAKKVRSNFKYKAVNKIEDALDDADFVIISILPGTFKEMESDVHTPEKYGILQSVGDTTGPGGFFRALRTIPYFVEFAKKIKEMCPEAYILNYTNPMAVCVKTLYEVYPNIKVIGCCHEVLNVKKLIVNILKKELGICVNYEDIFVNVLGVNHFTWINKAHYKNIDLMPIIKDFAKKHIENGYEDKGRWNDGYFNSANKVKFDLLLKYEVLAAAGDRHLAEFLMEDYLSSKEIAERYMFTLTPVSWRIQNHNDLLEKRKKIISGQMNYEVNSSGEEGVRIIKALLGIKDYITNINNVNKGQMEGVEHGAIVETNAYITKGEVYPLYSGKLKEDVLNLIKPHAEIQKLIVEAAIKKDKNFAFEVFLKEKSIQKLTIENARKLFNEMFEKTNNYLIGWV